ncbi:MAG: UbiX family flavin prenyltransferase [Planctomycetaceae bacterium]
MKNVVLAITGASGSIYAVRLLEVLIALGNRIHLTISPSACVVFRTELGLGINLNEFDLTQILPDGQNFSEDSKLASLLSGSEGSGVFSSVFTEKDLTPGEVIYHHFQDFNAGIASGSFKTDGMVICPCSMGTLASLANGQSSNLIHRAADVHLKERRKLIVVPRETPLGSIQLDNMKRLSDAGAVILPAMPGFYHNPLTIHDLIDFVVGRICDQLNLDIDLTSRWGE